MVMGPKRAMVDQGRAGKKMKLRVEEDSESDVPSDATSSSGSQSETEQDDASDVFDEEADMEERLPPEAPQPDKSHKLSFHNLTPALNPKVLEAVDALGFTHMTPVQAATLPLFLTHKDVLVEVSPQSRLIVHKSGSQACALLGNHRLREDFGLCVAHSGNTVTPRETA